MISVILEKGTVMSGACNSASNLAVRWEALIVGDLMFTHHILLLSYLSL